MPSGAFHETRTGYPACGVEGIELTKTLSGLLNVRLTPDTHVRHKCHVESLAKQTGMPINSFIRNAVEKQIAVML